MSLYEDITGKKYVEPSKKEKQAIPDWMANNTTTQKKKKNKWFKESSYFDDGYDIGDVTKTIIKTGGDVLTNVGKGFLNTVEGVVDTARTGIGDLTKTSANVQADIWDFLGNKAYASNLRKAGQDVKDLTYKNAKMDVTGAILGETNDLFKENWSAKMNEGSVLGTVPQSVSQGIGNIGAFVGLSVLTGGSTMATFGNSFTSAYGNTLTNGLRNGLDEKEAKGQAITSGLAEAISEQFFQGIPGLKSAGWADNLISKPIGKYFSGKTGKVALKVFDSLGEGFEEVISNVLQSTFEGIRKGDNVKQIWNDATGQITNEETRDAFISALISSALTNGGSALVTNAQKNQIIDAYAKEHNMTVKETKNLFDSIVEKKANLEETPNYKERVETEEGISKQLVKDLQNNKVDLNELFKQTPNSLKEMQFRFNQEEAKNVRTEKQNILANDMARLNDEKSNHELYKVINAIQSANDTQQYHITTTEGLYEMGIVNKDENGNYTMPDGSPYVPRGLNYKNGEIYINADVGSQSGTQAVYHEMFEGFKKAAPEQYNEFKQMVTDIIGEENIQKEFDTYKSMYGEELTDDIRDEIINDKFGELAENQNFINKIADNRNVLEKFIDSIKNMIKYVKGTNEERQLMKLQKNLEKEFAKRYKKTDFSKSEGDTAYSLGKHYGDLGKGNDTYYGHMYDSRRSTGHFGTGTYFVGEDYQPGEHSSYANRPVQKVEFDDYNNLFKPANRDAGFDLHDGLKEVNYNNTPISKELYDKLLPYYEASFNSYNELLDEDYDNDYKNVRNLLEEAGVETEEPQNYYDSGKGQYGKTYEKYLEDEITEVLNNYDRYQKAERDLKRVLGITDEQFNEAIEKVRQAEKEYEKHSYDQKLKDDSLSTVFMKTLGYNGVDVRGLEGLDDTTYGSVIYDLDNKTNNQTLNDYEIYQNELNETLNKAKNIGEDFYNNMKNQLDEYKERHPLEYNIYEQTKSRPATNENYNSDFFKEHSSDYDGKSGTNTADGRLTVLHLQKGDNLAKLSFTENQDKIWIDELYVKNQKQGYGSEIVNAIKDYANRTGKYVEAFKELQTAKGFWDKTLRSDTKYSLTSNKDSQGRELSKQQQEYFKDSKVVDENGNLLEVYHGTKTKGINIFNYDSNRQTGTDFGEAYYFTSDYNKAKGYQYDLTKDERVQEFERQHEQQLQKVRDNNFSKESRDEFLKWSEKHRIADILNDEEYIIKNADNIGGETKKVYLNLTNPLIVDAEGQNYYNVYPEYFKKARENGNDGIIVKNVVDNPRGEQRPIDTYIAFNPNQIKNVDNTNPTSNEDIRYSLTTNKDSNGKTLSKGQQEYFKDTKIVDNEGNLLEVYRGEPTIGKTTYESRKGGGNKEINEYGIYFTNSKDFAKDFAFERIQDPNDIFFVKKGKEGEVKSAYLNITNPLDLGTITEEEIRNLYPYESSMAKQLYDEDKFVSDMLHFQEIGNHQLMKSYLDMKAIADNTDYDGLVAKLNVQGNEIEYAVFNSNQIKAIDNINPTSNEDIRFSLAPTKDNTGKELTKEQQNFFKNVSPEVRDENGNLMRFYHGGEQNYNVFRSEFDEYYFTPDENAAQDYGSLVRPFYLNFTNPYVVDFEGRNDKANDLYENGVFDVIDYAKENGYDGAIIRNTYDGANTHDQYVAFAPNQIKNVDNLNPTDNPDIRYSLTGNVELFTTPYGVEVVKNPTNEQYQEMRNELLHQYPWLMGTGEVLLRHTYDEEGNEYYWSSFDAQHSAVEPYINKLYNTRTNQNYKWYEKENKDDYPTDYSWVDTSNFNPKYSLTSNENIDSKEVAPIGTTTEETIAPIRKDINNLTEKIDNLSTQLETMQNGAEIAPIKGYVEQYKPQKGEDKNSTPLNEESAETYANALSNDEGYIKSLEESAENYIEPNGIEQSNAVKLANKAGDLLGLSTEQIMNLRERIKEYAQKDYTVDEIREDLEKNFASRTYIETSNAMKEAKQIIRQTPLNVSQAIKNDIADYGDFKKKHFGKMTFSRNGLPVDVAYKKLMESSLKGVLNQDIVNPTDELLELARIVDESNKYEVEIVATPEELDNAADFIQQSILNAKYEEQETSLNSLDRSLENYEEIAPTTIRTQESIDNTIQNRDIAPIRQDVVDKTNPKNQNKLPKTWQTLQETMINRNYVIDKLAKTTGNQDVKYKGDAWNNVSSEAQYNINKYQTDNNYNRVGKSIKDIFEPSKKAGLYEAFNDYLIQKSNIERTDAGKGSAIPYEVSVQLVNMYENENPQFKTWAKDVYKYFDNVLQDQVDSGLISQEEYDYFRGETGIYRSYVPFYPGEFVASRYFDNEGNLKTPTTLKRSKGGAHDILAVEDSMAKQTYAYKNAIRQNDLFNEIVSTLGANDNGLAAELRGNPTDLDMSLFVDPETNDKYVTAYVEGDRYSAKISDELYNELGRIKENQVKEFEDNLSGILNPIQKVSNVRRNLLTAWNPVFLLRNGIKDIQDAMINSKQTGEMLKAYFGVGQKAAIFELREGKTKEAQQFLAAYGTEGTYGDYTGDTKSKIINKISNANELIELAPRFAEFKATLKNGGSVQQALYNAREVTTNFGRGGYLAKAMNRNGFTFLNANIQGLDKIVRNLSGENGAKGVVSVVAKGALFGIAPAILNELLFGAGDDKDKEYEALPDYVKDNYYLIKLQNGKFLRIPKGRVLSVIGSAARRTIEAVEGEENAFEGWGENAWSQIGVGDSGGLQTIFTPIRQAIKNEAWYGGDIVPTRLQKLPAEEQYDEKTDAISKKIGEIFKVSPKKVNYVIDQYSGGIGDLFLPTITPATSNGAEGVGYLTAPLKDAFVVNSTDDNKYASEFYTLKDELQIRSNSSKATDEEQLRYKYINSVSSELSNLYTERREVQADTTLSKSEKYEKVQKIQDEINALTRDGIVQSKDIKVTEDYATVNDVEYYKDDEGKWQKLSDNDILDTAGMTGIEKSTYFHAKEKISVYNKEYKEQTKDLNKSTDTDLINQYAAEKKQNIINAVINSGLSNEDKAILYSNYYSSEETMNNIVNAGYDVDDYITAMNDIEILREEYSAKKGYSTAQRKALTISYVDSLNMNEAQKAMMLRQYYSSFDSYNNEIVNYVSNLNISQEEKIAILKQCKFTVKQKNDDIVVSW